MVKICQKCGFENIDQTFFCSHCGDQIGKLPEKPVEDISQESLKKSEKARARSDALITVAQWNFLGIWGILGKLLGSKRTTVSEKEAKKMLDQEKKKKP